MYDQTHKLFEASRLLPLQHLKKHADQYEGVYEAAQRKSCLLYWIGNNSCMKLKSHGIDEDISIHFCTSLTATNGANPQKQSLFIVTAEQAE